MKKISLLLATLGIINLTSCDYIQKALTYNCLLPVSGDSLVLATYFNDNEHLSFAPSQLAYEALVNRSEETYDVVVFDLTKGLELIQSGMSNYKLARVTGYGNAYLISKEKDAISKLNPYDTLLTYSSAYKYYEEDPYGIGMMNAVFNYSAGRSALSTELFDEIYSDPKDVYLSALSNSDIDAVILTETYASKLIQDVSLGYKHYLPLSGADGAFAKASVENGLSEEGYAHYLEYGLFVSPSFENESKEEKKLHENFFHQIDNSLQNLERNDGSNIINYLDNATNIYEINLTELTGANNDEWAKILPTNYNYGNITNPCGACSFEIDIADFYSSTNGSKDDKARFHNLANITEECYSHYYNGIR